MATIKFKAKPLAFQTASVSGHYVNVPAIERRHCDMAAFRQHPKFGWMANSDLFPNLLKRLARDIAPSGIIRTDKVPDNVTIDQSAFLWTVTITV